MFRYPVISVIMLLSSFICLRAQDYVGENLDGLEFETDSLSIKTSFAPPSLLSPFLLQKYLPAGNSIKMAEPLYFETEGQHFARINSFARDAAMKSINQSLYWVRRPEYSKTVTIIMMILGRFMANPSAPPAGCIILNSSSPQSFMKVPGMAPYEYQYNSEKYPKFVESEYDFSTGTYRPVMVNRDEVQRKIESAKAQNKMHKK